MGDNVFGIVRLLGMALRMSSLNLEEPSDKAFQVEVKKKKKDFLVVFYESDNTP